MATAVVSNGPKVAIAAGYRGGLWVARIRRLKAAAGDSAVDEAILGELSRATYRTRAGFYRAAIRIGPLAGERRFRSCQELKQIANGDSDGIAAIIERSSAP